VIRFSLPFIRLTKEATNIYLGYVEVIIHKVGMMLGAINQTEQEKLKTRKLIKTKNIDATNAISIRICNEAMPLLL